MCGADIHSHPVSPMRFLQRVKKFGPINGRLLLFGFFTSRIKRLGRVQDEINGDYARRKYSTQPDQRIYCPSLDLQGITSSSIEGHLATNQLHEYARCFAYCRKHACSAQLKSVILKKKFAMLISALAEKIS